MLWCILMRMTVLALHTQQADSFVSSKSENKNNQLIRLSFPLNHYSSSKRRSDKNDVTHVSQVLLRLVCKLCYLLAEGRFIHFSSVMLCTDKYHMQAFRLDC